MNIKDLPLKIGLEVLSNKAKEGSPNDQYLLGSYYYSIGDLVNAIDVLKEAAKQNHIESQFMLGMSLTELSHKALDWSIFNESMYWLQKAADSGHKEAINTLENGGSHNIDFLTSKTGDSNEV